MTITTDKPEPSREPIQGYFVRELANHLRVSLGLIYAEINRGRLHTLKAGSRIIIPQTAVDEWLRLR